MAETKLCPFMSRPIIDITGAGIPLPQMYLTPCIEDRCRAWHPTVNKPRRVSEDETIKIDGHHVAPGWCMLIPASEPELKFIQVLDPLSLLDDDEEEDL